MEYEAKHIILRKARMEDTAMMYENFWSDKEVAKTMFWQPSESLEEAYGRMARTIELQKDKTLFFVARKDTDEPIGVCGIYQESEGVYTEAGIGLARKVQHQGWGKEVLGLLLKMAFENCHAQSFAYYCMKGNEPSVRLAKSFGFTYESEAEEVRGYDQKSFVIERYILSRQSWENATK